MFSLTHKSNLMGHWALRYSLFGFLFGFTFPLIGTAFEVVFRGMPFTLASFWQAQATQPLLWMVDSAPFFLGGFSCVAGIRQDQVVGITEELEHKVAERTAELTRLNHELRNDIVARQQIEENLWQSEERYRAAANYTYESTHSSRIADY